MVLNEFHVTQWHAVPVGQSHTVAGHDAAIGILPEHPAGTAGGNHHGAGMDRSEYTGGQRKDDCALGSAVFRQ